MDKRIVRHLSAYLPYDVKFFGYERYWKIECLYGNGALRLKSVDATTVILDYQDDPACKIVLKPLSVLSGIKCQNLSDKVGSIPDRNNFTNWYIADTEWLHQADEVKEYMLEHHYDVYGLIGRGLAVDYFTLNN